MKQINWNIFKAKFQGNESGNFENLAYQLFCSEHGNETGIFRFKNQTGIETEPIVSGGKTVGFQAKYYDTKIAQNKEDIIDSLKKAKRENPRLDTILLYVNKEISENPKKGKKIPQYMKDIEAAAATIGVVLEWRVTSHFERQLALQKNEYLADFYFSQEESIVDFLAEITIHTENLLQPIQTDILFIGRTIKLDRQAEIKELQDCVGASSGVIISGEGGAGKTAVIKEFHQKAKQLLPFYVFKAAEFKVENIQILFQRFGDYSLRNFINAHDEEPKKVVLIDSAEKISDLENQEPFKEFLATLLKNNWTVLFTSRLSYLDDLRFQLASVFRISFREISVKGISPAKLDLLSAQYSFEVPANPKLRTLIQNPFYLNEYLRHYATRGKVSTYRQLKDSIWSRKIQNTSYTKGNAHILREKCFLSIVKHKTEQGKFFVYADGCSEETLALLQDDEIIVYDRSTGGYFVTHDIYEEWGQNVLIDRAFAYSKDSKPFLDAIGNSLSTRRAFRAWLSDKLYDNEGELKEFVANSFTDSEIESFWKDEIVTAVLLSDYSGEFFEKITDLLLKEDHKMLKRVLFMLRISCKEADNSVFKMFGNDEEINLKYVFTKPKGSGWISVIDIIFQRRDTFSLNSLHYLLPILQDWCSYAKRGITTKQVGLIALQYYEELTHKEEYHYSGELADKLVKVIVSCVFEIKEDLSKIFDEVLAKGKLERRGSYYELCKILVSSEYDIIPVIKELPEYVIRFADLFWFEADRHPSRYDGMGVEKYYSLSSRREYSPASAYQTPIYWLLHFHFEKAVDFIVNFTNRAVKFYVESGFDKSIKEVEVTLSSGTKKKQYLSHGLWQMYRGCGSPVTPYLLQSLHMALEKILLERAEKEDLKNLEDSLIYLIENSDSASISAVVASVVLAHPNKLYGVAKVLLSCSVFILYDNVRALSGEHHAKSLASIGRGLNGRNRRYEMERIKTFEQKHRKNSLENLIIQYQFFRHGDTSEETSKLRQQELWTLIDHLGAELPEKAKETDFDKTIRLLLSRIDRRRMNPKIEQKGNSILIDFNPTIDEDLKKHSDQALEHSNEVMRYSALHLWGENKFKRRDEYGNYEQYESNPKLVLKETREIVEELTTAEDPNELFYNKSTPAYTASALVRKFGGSMSPEDLQFCRDIIIGYAMLPLQEGYDYQISDGVEVAVNTIPHLMELFQDKRDEFKMILLLVLLDPYPIGQYKRVCDYSIEAIENELWKSFPEDTKQILFAYLKFTTKYNELLNKSRDAAQREERWPKLSQPKLIKELQDTYEDEVEGYLLSPPKFEELRISDYSLDELEIAFKLVPNDTSDESLIKFVSEMMPEFAKSLLHDDRQREVDYSLRQRVFEKYSIFILNRDLKEVNEFVQPFVEEFACTEYMASFFQELISAEDKLEKYDQFWNVWECFYPQVTSAHQLKGYYVSQVIHNYLLAWNYWKETAQEWHSLKSKEKIFYQRVINDIGHLPSVFDAIAKFLNEIGSGFLNEGISWIADLVSKNSQKKLEKNTIFYVEKLVRRYVYLNRLKVKRDNKVKHRVLVILNFLIERGSVNAYLIREDII